MRDNDRGGLAMSGSDKARNKAQRLKGAVKEVVGRAIGDVALERQGRQDQRESHLKDAGEKVKDAFRPRGPRRRQPKLGVAKRPRRY
jgi:uncharacterized protein YjbJ (UPF0337 family)